MIFLGLENCAEFSVLRLDKFPPLQEQFMESLSQTIGDKCRSVQM